MSDLLSELKAQKQKVAFAKIPEKKKEQFVELYEEINDELILKLLNKKSNLTYTRQRRQQVDKSVAQAIVKDGKLEV